MRTTLNMRNDVYTRLNFLSERTGLKKSEVVLFVLRKFRESCENSEIMGTNVMYQSTYSDWRLFHMHFDAIEREIAHDMRKIYKLSLSFIVAYGINRFGDLLLAKKEGMSKGWIEEYMHNYTTDKYHYNAFSEKGCKIMIIKWKSGGGKEKKYKDYRIRMER